MTLQFINELKKDVTCAPKVTQTIAFQNASPGIQLKDKTQYSTPIVGLKTTNTESQGEGGKKKCELGNFNTPAVYRFDGHLTKY